MSYLSKLFTELFTRVAEVERKHDGAFVDGTVHPGSVDAKAGTCRLRIGGTDDAPFLSPPIPYSQIMGALKVHSPPSDGQQMRVMCVGGDYRQGLALPFTQSDKNPSPSQKPDEHVTTFGSVKNTLHGKGKTYTSGDTTHKYDDTGVEASKGGAKHRVDADAVNSSHGGQSVTVNKKAVFHKGQKVVLNGGGGGGASAQDTAAKNAIKAKALADLNANPNAKNVSMSATLPSGASYKYTVSR